MSAVCTKKPGADYGVQLTYPTVFAEQYLKDGTKNEYYPEHIPRIELQHSNTLQGDYHRQKMEDAHRMVLAKVKSRHSMNYKAEHGPHGYYNHEKPVLGQRKYANPSNGNQADIYSNRPIQWEVDWGQKMEGGVLYTAQAQKWGRDKLYDRIRQLDNITSAKEAFHTNEPFQEVQKAQETLDKVKIEIAGHLQGLLGAVADGELNNFAFNDLVKLQKILFRWASTANEEELEEVLDTLTYIETDLRGIKAEAQTRGIDKEDYDDIVYRVVVKLVKYLKRMIGTVNRPVSERKSVSSNLLKTLGFTKLSLKSVIAQAEEDNRNAGPSIKPKKPKAFPTEVLGVNPREKKGADNGAFLGDALEGEEDVQQKMESAQLRSQGFQDLKDAGVPEEQDEDDVRNKLFGREEKEEPESSSEESSSVASSSESESESESPIQKPQIEESKPKPKQKKTPEISEADIVDILFEGKDYTKADLTKMKRTDLMQLINEVVIEGHPRLNTNSRMTKNEVIEKMIKTWNLPV
jgi:hypothetical protein